MGGLFILALKFTGVFSVIQILFLVFISKVSLAFEIEKRSPCTVLLKSDFSEYYPKKQIPLEGKKIIENGCKLYFSKEVSEQWVQSSNFNTVILYEENSAEYDVDFLYLHNRDGLFTAFWNGGGQSQHAHNTLNQTKFMEFKSEKMTCWENKISKICFNPNLLYPSF